jgi:hypothetical protein
MNGSRKPVRILSRNGSRQDEKPVQPPLKEDPAAWPQLDLTNNSPQTSQPRYVRRKAGTDSSQGGSRRLASARFDQQSALWIRNYFFRIWIRIWIPFSAEFWIRIRKKIVTDPDTDPTSKKFWIQFRIRP